MAGFFYAMHRALRLSKSLLATVHSAKWEALKNKKAIILRAAVDIKDDAYWKRVYIVLRAFWPVLKLLRIADSNKAGMDKIYFLTHKASLALEKSKESLDDDTLFSVEDLVDAEADAIYLDSEDEEDLEDEGEGDVFEEEEEEDDSLEDEDLLVVKSLTLFIKDAKISIPTFLFLHGSYPSIPMSGRM